MKLCNCCDEEKDEKEFPVRNDRSGRLRPYCKVCANDIQRSRYKAHKAMSPFLHKCTRAKSRANYLKVPFNLTPEYLESIWTGVCPALNVQISFTEKDRTDEFAAELDRFVPELGYTIGNVTFLSRKANRLKNSASISDLEGILNWMKSYENHK